jgi:hypothetical protein
MIKCVCKSFLFFYWTNISKIQEKHEKNTIEKNLSKKKQKKNWIVRRPGAIRSEVGKAQHI